MIEERATDGKRDSSGPGSGAIILIGIGVWLFLQATIGQLPARIKAWNDYRSGGGATSGAQPAQAAPPPTRATQPVGSGTPGQKGYR